jgi:cysteine desulfurase
MSETLVYLDYNATTPLDPLVLKEMEPYFLHHFGNPSSRHVFGFEASGGIKKARKRVADLISAEAEEILFTSGATESINIVHFGIARAYYAKGKHIITTVIEHPAVLDSLNFLEQNGYRISYLPVNKEGLIDLAELTRTLSSDTILVSIMAANNEIGVINDLAAIGKICSDFGVLFHTDASQVLGKIPVDVNEMKIDLLSFSGHKFYAPKGTGGLYVRKKSPKIKLSPIQFGGGQEKGLRPGTLNTPGIVGLGKAAEICMNSIDKEAEEMVRLRDKLFQGLKGNIEDLEINGSFASRLPNNLNVSVHGIKATDLMMDLRDIAFSTASACSSESEKPSYVLKAIGLDDDEAKSSVRLSIGRFTTDEEIEFVISRFSETVLKLKNYSQK